MPGFSGNFGDVESFDYTRNDIEQHIQRIEENNSLLQQSGALPIVYAALRKACEEHDRRRYDERDLIESFIQLLISLKAT